MAARSRACPRRCPRSRSANAMPLLQSAQGLQDSGRRLAMTIEPIMSRDVHHCRPDHTLDYAASQMWEHDCGCLPVCTSDDGGEPRVIGMLTDRDICMAAL